LNSTLALYNTITKLSNLIIQYLHRIVIPKIKKDDNNVDSEWTNVDAEQTQEEADDNNLDSKHTNAATNDTNKVLFSTDVGRFDFKLFINKLHIFLILEFE
jgi:hypothetical protein